MIVCDQGHPDELGPRRPVARPAARGHWPLRVPRPELPQLAQQDRAAAARDPAAVHGAHRGQGHGRGLRLEVVLRGDGKHWCHDVLLVVCCLCIRVLCQTNQPLLFVSEKFNYL